MYCTERKGRKYGISMNVLYCIVDRGGVGGRYGVVLGGEGVRLALPVFVKGRNAVFERKWNRTNATNKEGAVTYPLIRG